MSCKETIAEINPKAYLLPEEYDSALIGYVSHMSVPAIAVYEAEKVIEILQEELSYEEASEHFEFNIAGSYLGKNTPLFLRKGIL